MVFRLYNLGAFEKKRAAVFMVLWFSLASCREMVDSETERSESRI